MSKSNSENVNLAANNTEPITEKQELHRNLTYSISGTSINPQEIANRLEKSGVPRDNIKITNHGVSVKINNPTVEQLNIINEMSPSDPFRISGFHTMMDWNPFGWSPFSYRSRHRRMDVFNSMHRMLDYFDRAFQCPYLSYNECLHPTSTRLPIRSDTTEVTNEQLQELLKSMEDGQPIDKQLMKKLIQNELNRRST